MALSSICLLNTTTMSYSKNSGYPNRTLTSSGVTFGTSTTRTDPNYGLITVNTSATDGISGTTSKIYNMLDNNNSTYWRSYNFSTKNAYYDYDNVLSTFTGSASGDGGEYGDSGTSGYAAGSGTYYGIIKNSSLTKFSTIYTDSQGTQQTVYGSYINVSFASTIKIALKNFTIGGRTSYNWDDLPREILILGSNNATNWTLVNDASDFGKNSPWKTYVGKIDTPWGYKDASGADIPYTTYTWDVSATSKYRYIRFIIKSLIRGRVLNIYYFNMAYDVYVG